MNAGLARQLREEIKVCFLDIVFGRFKSTEARIENLHVFLDKFEQQHREVSRNQLEKELRKITHELIDEAFDGGFEITETMPEPEGNQRGSND